MVLERKAVPETVLLRLITAHSRPNAKLGAGKSRSGLLIAGESDPTYVQVLAEGYEPRAKLSKGGRTRALHERDGPQFYQPGLPTHRNSLLALSPFLHAF